MLGNLERVVEFHSYRGGGVERTFTEVVFGKQVSVLRVRQRGILTNERNYLKYVIHPRPACKTVCTACRLCSAVSVALLGGLVPMRPNLIDEFVNTCRRVVEDLTAWACI